MASTSDLLIGSAPTPRTVSVDDSASWIHKALEDFRRTPVTSLIYGAVSVVVSWLVVGSALGGGLGSVSLPLASGFMLVAPMIAVPLHVISRAHEAGERIGLIEAIARSRVSVPGLSIVGVLLMLILLAWMLLALLIFAVFYGGSPPLLTHFLAGLLNSPQAPLFLVTGTAIGAVMAMIAFAVAFLSIPLLVDNPDMPPTQAIAVSLQSVLRQPGVLGGWGATLVFITVSGMVPAFLGLAFTLPLAGYASWHAYRAVLPRSG